MKQDTVLLEMQYLSPIRYYAKLLQYPKMLIEKYEHFEKSTYRNRCYLAGPNGILRLTIPLAKGKNQHTVIKDVRISYDVDWQKIHWLSLCSIYRTSPYFEFYEEKFAPFYEKRFKFLFDFNEQLMRLMLNLLQIEPLITFTKEYKKKYGENILDYRSAIHPNQKRTLADSSFQPPKYTQVFEDKAGFQPDMSIVDLLFCEGPHSIGYLTE